MPFIKSAVPAGKKQAPMPGPQSAAYKKIVAARKNAAAKSANAKRANKRPKTSLFSTLKSRQLMVERVKREIWASVHEINQAIINLALCGNYSAAKALFDFAGVYSLPSPEEGAASASFPASSFESTTPAISTAAPNPVDEFFKSIGIEPAGDEPEPGMAA